jgi:hypothetical protein
MAKTKRTAREQALRTALSRFTSALIREAKAKTGWTHEKLHAELFRACIPGEREADRGMLRTNQETFLSQETYRRYLLPPSNPKSRAPLAARVQTLENRVAELVGRPAEKVVIWNYLGIQKAGSELSRHGPPIDFKNFGVPGETKVRGIPSKDLSLCYAQPAYTYLADLITQAKLWPSLARSWQISADNDEPFDRAAQTRWLLTWQLRIQSERAKTPNDAWQKYWRRLPEDFRTICDASAGSLPIIPEIWPKPLLNQIADLNQLLSGTRSLPSFFT